MKEDYDDYDDDDYESYNETKCLCFPIELGMLINGILFMFIGFGQYYFLKWAITDGPQHVKFYVACLLMGSHTYIMAFTALCAALVGFSVQVARHPMGRLQLAYLNALTTIVFMLTVIHNGYVAPETAKVDIQGFFRKFNRNSMNEELTSRDEFLKKFRQAAMWAIVGILLTVAFNRNGGEFWVAFFITSMLGHLIMLAIPGTFCLIMTIYAIKFITYSQEKYDSWRSHRQPLLA